MDPRQKCEGQNHILSRWILPGLGMLMLTGLVLHLAWLASPGHSNLAGICPDVQRTQKYTFLWGGVTINATPAPSGSIVEARSPRGDTVGCQVVENAGEYPLMYVYGEETVAGTPVPGMRAGEVIAFAVDRLPATPNPVPTWADDWASHQVDLAAVGETVTPTPTNTPTPCYDFDTSGTVDSGDIQAIASAWRNTDAASLDDYDFNENNIVDVGDIQTVAAHWGESCS